MAFIRWKAKCCKIMFLLQLCGLLAIFVAIVEGQNPSSGRYHPVVIPDTLQEVFKRALLPNSAVTGKVEDRQGIVKRAVPPEVAEKAMEIGGELAEKTAEELFDKIGEAGDRAAGYLENGASVDVEPQNGFMSEDMFAPPAWHVDVGVENDNDDEESPGEFFTYPMGVGPMMYNGCYGNNYQPGDPCYEARVPSQATCVELLDAAGFIGVGFDGRGSYSPDSSKMSIIQRNCAGLSTYDGFDVPDTMNVHGIYETKSNMMTFEDRNEYTKYLETEAGISGSLFFGSAGVTAAYGRSDVSNEQKYMSVMDIDVIRYEIFKEVTTANDLSTDFIKEYMSLPTNYHAPGNPRKFQDFLQRWGTHYIESGVFGGRLEIKKVSSASFYSSVEKFAVEAKYDFDAFFASVHAKFSQKGETTEAKQTSYSNVNVEAFGGDQEIAAVLTDAGSPTIKTDLVDWLDSIPDYPKAIKFGVAPITDLLYFRVEDIFPNKDFDDCNNVKKLREDDEGNKFYYAEKIVGNVTVQEKQYCKYQSQEELMSELDKRRESLDRAISVYMSEGLVSDDEISVPAGSNYCEFSNVEINSDTGPPNWDNIMSGHSFTLIFDMDTDIEGGYHGRIIPKDDIVTMHYFVGKWFVEKNDGTARLGDGYGNGGSDNTENLKISVDGLVLTFIPEASMFLLKAEDYTASLDVWPKLFAGLKNMYLARVEWPISLRTANAEEKNFLNSAMKTFPCNTQWSNIQTFDVSYGTNQTKPVEPITITENEIHIATTGTATQSSTKNDKGGAENAVDGDKNSYFPAGSCTHTENELNPWWKLDLGSEYIVHKVIMTNREDCCRERLLNAEVQVGNSGVVGQNKRCGDLVGSDRISQSLTIVNECQPPLLGRYVSVQVKSPEGIVTLCEVEAFVQKPVPVVKAEVAVDAGQCLYFTAVSEGSIYVAFASVPKDKKTWYFVEISPEVAAIHKYNHVLTETSYMNAKGLGDGVLQQNYYICVSLMAGGASTLIEYGKFKDEQTRTIYLSYIDKHSPIVPMFYGFGSGSKDVTIFHVKVHSRTPPSSWSSCGPGTTFDGDSSLCLLNCDVNCDPDYGCMISESGQPSPKLCNECKNVRKTMGTVFECTDSCPVPEIVVDNKRICPCKWVLNGNERECYEDCPSGTHLDPETSVCIDGCADPGEVANSIRLGDDFSNGAIVRYKCYYGHSLDGEGELTCLHGAWTSTKPLCKLSSGTDTGDGDVGIKWRSDYRCGSGDLLPNGDRAECDPNGQFPCCSPGGWCGYKSEHCSCDFCIDYRKPKVTDTYNGHLYYIDPKPAYTRAEAKELCKADNAYLVTINNAEEAEFLKQFSLNEAYLWIGLNDIAVEGQYKWEDGTPFTYSSWRSGNPDNHDNNEDCVHIHKQYGTEWNDMTCVQTLGYICERDKTWRDDGRCGEGYTLADGRVAECDPHSEYPCCAYTHCVSGADHCTCPECTVSNA